MKPTFSSGGIDIDTDIFRPSGAPNGGAIVIAHGSDGMKEPWGEMIRGYGKDLAGLGFVALIPHYFKKTNTDDEMGRTELATIAPPSRRDDWQKALADCLIHTATLPSIDSQRIGLLGFSLGGHLALRLRGSVKVLVEFFAPEFIRFGGIGTGTPSGLHVQIHHGADDRVVSSSPDAANIERILLGEGVEVSRSDDYLDAGHGFMARVVNDETMGGTDEGNSQAGALAKTKTLQFFKDYL